MKTRRRRIRHVTSFKQRVNAFAEGIRIEAAKLKPGNEREALLKRVRQAETAMHIDEWMNSPGLQPPR